MTSQLNFLMLADQLKNVERRTYISDGSRHENSAEHSWHFALGVLLFAEYAREANLDLTRALKLAVLHDLVEIGAGDTFIYDQNGQESRLEREQQAAEALFGVLPDDQKAEFRALWDEFEAKTTPEAQFCAVIDRLCPVLLNFVTDGRAWKAHDVAISQVEKLVLPDFAAAPELSSYVQILLQQAVENGFLKRG
jgi:putative hydrolases of HD superfamily